MILKEYLDTRIRGWLPKDHSLAYSKKPLSSRWKNPYLITLTVFVLITAVFVTYGGVQTYLRYNNPKIDITSSYYQKILNSSIARIGDVVEVKVQVYWHGYLIPEFKRDIRIVDSFPENTFQLIEGSNTFRASGYGGSYEIRYLLKITSLLSANIELPEPKLYLDAIEVPLNRVDTNSKIQILP